MSFVGNCGTFTRGYRAMILDVEFLYHLLYLLICAMGLFVHEFFYSLLVSSWCPQMLHVENQESVLPLVPPCNGNGCAWCIMVIASHLQRLGELDRKPPGSWAAVRCPGGAGHAPFTVCDRRATAGNVCLCLSLFLRLSQCLPRRVFLRLSSSYSPAGLHFPMKTWSDSKSRSYSKLPRPVPRSLTDFLVQETFSVEVIVCQCGPSA